jgi:broad specificity phosphatase PhoE
MLLYLRHGDDRGDDVYRHDRRLNDRGREKAAKAVKRLIEKHGHPDVAYVSPFRRAIETLEVMATRFDRTVDMRRDPRIAQCFLGKRDPKVSPETRSVIDVAESRNAFRSRVAAHVTEARAVPGVVWCVTHQVVIEEAARHFGVDVSSDLDFLDCAVMLG